MQESSCWILLDSFTVLVAVPNKFRWLLWDPTFLIKVAIFEKLIGFSFPLVTSIILWPCTKTQYRVREDGHGSCRFYPHLCQSVRMLSTLLEAIIVLSNLDYASFKHFRPFNFVTGPTTKRRRPWACRECRSHLLRRDNRRHQSWWVLIVQRYAREQTTSLRWRRLFADLFCQGSAFNVLWFRSKTYRQLLVDSGLSAHGLPPLSAMRKDPCAEPPPACQIDLGELVRVSTRSFARGSHRNAISSCVGRRRRRDTHSIRTSFWWTYELISLLRLTFPSLQRWKVLGEQRCVGMFEAEKGCGLKSWDSEVRKC